MRSPDTMEWSIRMRTSFPEFVKDVGLPGISYLIESLKECQSIFHRSMLNQDCCRVAKCQYFYTEKIFEMEFYPKKSA